MPRKRLLLMIGVAAAILRLGVVSLGGQSPRVATDRAEPKPAEQVYKNIQVLKGVPADQVIPAMQFAAASLGVQCDFCHLENAFEKDDKDTKQKARKMMRMMFAINKDSFDGHREVTCYSCHRGAHRPVVIPAISNGENNLVPEEDMPHHDHEQPNAVGLPSATQIIARYLQAIGGREAVGKISTLTQKGTLILGSKTFGIEILAKAPDKRVSTMHFPGGDSVTAINGKEGWLSTAGVLCTK
jgi:photosynthetic reaction center cytochrome c subunit